MARQLSYRIAEHCKRYGRAEFTVEFHGGEPLLLGRERMQQVIDVLSEGCPGVSLRFILQTNGTLLDEEWLKLFTRHDISFGVSLDGPPAIADQFRVLRSGGGSTESVLANLHHLRTAMPSEFNRLFGGCLCVVNPVTNGADMVDWFVEQGVTKFDFLLPDGNSVNLPHGWADGRDYTRFLLEAFERWYALGARAPEIRKFDLMMMGLMGAKAPLDALGGDLSQLCVVESDGSIGVNDVARICGGNLSNDIASIFTHRLDQHIDTYSLNEIQKPCTQCVSCEYFASCGGGYLPHRFDGTGFDNPSLYCDALYQLSERMMSKLEVELPAAAWRTPEPQTGAAAG